MVYMIGDWSCTAGNGASISHLDCVEVEESISESSILEEFGIFR